MPVEKFANTAKLAHRLVKFSGADRPLLHELRHPDMVAPNEELNRYQRDEQRESGWQSRYAADRRKFEQGRKHYEGTEAAFAEIVQNIRDADLVAVRSKLVELAEHFGYAGWFVMRQLQLPRARNAQTAKRLRADQPAFFSKAERSQRHTTSPRWFTASCRKVTIPVSGRDLLSRRAMTSLVA